MSWKDPPTQLPALPVSKIAFIYCCPSIMSVVFERLTEETALSGLAIAGCMASTVMVVVLIELTSVVLPVRLAVRARRQRRPQR